MGRGLLAAIAICGLSLVPVWAQAAVSVVNTATFDDGGNASAAPSATYTPSASGDRLVVCLGESGKTISATPANLNAYATQPVSTYGWCGYTTTSGTAPLTFTWSVSATANYRITVIELGGADGNAGNDIEALASHSGGATTQTVTAHATASGFFPVGIYMTITTSATVSANTYAGANATQLRLDTANGIWGLADDGAASTGAIDITHSVTTSAATYGAFMLEVLVAPAAATPAKGSRLLMGCCK